MIIYDNLALKYLKIGKRIITPTFHTKVDSLKIVYFQIRKLSLDRQSYFNNSLRTVLLIFKCILVKILKNKVSCLKN